MLLDYVLFVEIKSLKNRSDQSFFSVTMTPEFLLVRGMIVMKTPGMLSFLRQFCLQNFVRQLHICSLITSENVIVNSELDLDLFG